MGRNPATQKDAFDFACEVMAEITTTVLLPSPVKVHKQEDDKQSENEK